MIATSGNDQPKRELGHIAGQCGGARIDTWGTGPFLIHASGKEFRFEDSDRFGPNLIKRNGDPLAKPWPSERSPFWRAHRVWVRQGRRLEDDGVTCVWDEPKPRIAKRISKRHAVVLEHGEEDGKSILID